MKTYWHRRANISIGTVTTLEPGSDATASVTEDNVLSLGIPQGEQGEQGIQGPPMDYDDLSAEEKAALASDVTANLPKATASTLGVVSVGTGLSVDSDGVLSATGVESPEMTGADGTHPGTGGTVPAPAATDNVKYLRGDATWADPTPANATTSTAGLMSAADKTKLDGIASQATKGETSVVTVIDDDPSVFIDIDTWSSSSSYIVNYPKNYDFIIFEYYFGGTDNSTGMRRTKETTVYPLFKLKAETAGTSNYELDAVPLTVHAPSGTKVATRRAIIGRIRTSSRDQLGIEFKDAYYNGSKNNKYLLPTRIIAVKL